MEEVRRGSGMRAKVVDWFLIVGIVMVECVVRVGVEIRGVCLMVDGEGV